MDSRWTKELPRAPGLYWFWGYRYKTSVEPEVGILQVFRIRSGFTYVMDGNFVFEDEMSSNFFIMPIDLPELPKLAAKEPAVGDQPNPYKLKEPQ